MSDEKIDEILDLLKLQQQKLDKIDATIESKFCDLTGTETIQEARETFLFLRIFKMYSCRTMLVVLSAVTMAIVGGTMTLIVEGLKTIHR